MEQGCPDAWMLNITNPMTCLTRSVCRETTIKTVGLCHEVGHFCMDLAIAFGTPHTAIRPTVMGVNHFPVITALDIDGADGLVLLREMVDELGRTQALRPGTATARGRALHEGRLRPAARAEADRCSTATGPCPVPATAMWPSSSRRR